MKKYIVFLFTIVVLSSCSTTYQKITYRPDGTIESIETQKVPTTVTPTEAYVTVATVGAVATAFNGYQYRYAGINNGYWLFNGYIGNRWSCYRVPVNYANPLNASMAAGGGVPMFTQYLD